MSPSRSNRFLKLLPALGGVASFLAFWTPPAQTQQGSAPPPGTTGGNWRSYGGDIANTRYSPLSQIDASNFSKLQVAWIFNTANLGATPESHGCRFRC